MISVQKRLRKEVDLMEISLVTFPMNPKATVDRSRLVKFLLGDKWSA